MNFFSFDKSASKKRLNQIIFLVAGILLFAYVLFRAYNVPITVDEGTTYFVYVKQVSLLDVILNRPINTNNHFLNTLLMRMSISLFGDDVLALRLPSLIGHLFYLFFSFKLLRAISNRTIVILTGIVLLNFNPYFYDFFGLARGYSLSWGMMMASMYYLHQYISEKKNQYVWVSFIFAGLSVYSILIQLNYYMALVAVFNFVFFAEIFNRSSAILVKNSAVSSFIFLLKKNIPILISSVVLMILLIGPISNLRTQNEFYGARGGFYADTLKTLVNQSLFSKKYFGTDFPDVLIGIAITVFLLVIFFSVKKLRNAIVQKGSSNSVSREIAPLVFCILFTIACLSTIFQYHLLGTPYLTDRTGLIYFPLFSIIPIFFFTFLDHKKWLQFFFCMVPLVAYSYHFYNSANTFTVREWWFDTNTKNVIKYMVENENLEKQVTLAVFSWNSPSFHYHVKNAGLDNKIDVERRNQLAKNEIYDYYYIEGTWLHKISKEKYDVIANFDSRVLLKKKK